MEGTTALRSSGASAAEPVNLELACMEIWGGTEAAHNAVSTPGLDFYVHAEPFQGDDEGGDVHFVSVCGSGRTVRTVLADVSGHGEVVAGVARDLRGLVRKSMNTLDQSKMARQLNKQFAALETSGRFATAILATYFGPTSTLIVCNAGHPRPLHYNAAKEMWSLLDSEGKGDAPPPGKIRNLPFGIIEGTEYAQRFVQLGEGDLVVLYTDALMEAKDAQGAQLGELGLLEAAMALDSSLGAAQLMRGLIERVETYREGEADDDFTVVMLKRNSAKAKSAPSERLRVLSRMMGLSKV